VADEAKTVGFGMAGGGIAMTCSVTRQYEKIADRVRIASGAAEARMRTVVDVLWEELAATGVSWVGFYLDQPGQPDDRRMVLGPCRDKPACSPIGVHGVCGQSLLSGRTRIVQDVAALGANYIACDPRDRSEIVVPLIDSAGRCHAVLDIDSHDVGCFDEADDVGLRAVLRAAGLTA
jgi:putative methionine-R-sulfoxide reductase with GAF domain